jgi:MauM/NapG family ferredoxin protein
MSEKFNRREFLTLHWESSIGFLGNFLAPQMEIERNFFRPPGAVGELEFLTSCTRCSLCRDVCPEQSIRLFSLEDGAKLALTPYVNPNQIPCTLCKKCVDICPTNALNLEDFNARPYLGVANVQESFCLTSQQVMCDYCVRSCPTEGAIGLKDGKPVVSGELCNGCGICVKNCISEIKAIFINRRN